MATWWKRMRSDREKRLHDVADHLEVVAVKLDKTADRMIEQVSRLEKEQRRG